MSYGPSAASPDVMVRRCSTVMLAASPVTRPRNTSPTVVVSSRVPSPTAMPTRVDSTLFVTEWRLLRSFSPRSRRYSAVSTSPPCTTTTLCRWRSLGSDQTARSTASETSLIAAHATQPQTHRAQAHTRTLRVGSGDHRVAVALPSSHATADTEVGILRGFDSRRLHSPCKSHFPLGTVSLAGPRLPGRSRGRLCRGRRQTRSIRTLFGPLERLILTLIGGSCSESRFSACPRLSKPNVSASFTATSSRLTI